ncbi:unnamed protein product, partial [Rotaria sp. Silwood1]
MTNIYIKFFDFFANLNCLDCIEPSFTNNAVLSFVDLPSNTFVSSNLTKLRITVDSFGDCLRLLDGRLNQLSTFIVIIVNVKDSSSTEFNSNVLQNLKRFSLTYESLTNEYDNQVVPLLRQMCNLQDLTLYIQIKERNRLVDGIQLENDVLIHLLKLQTFVFYICTLTYSKNPVTPLSNDDIQRTFSSVKFGQVGCTQSKDSARSEHDNNESFEVVQYLHLRSLEFCLTHIDYVEQMLNESKTHLPCLTELVIDYDQLKTITNNFTRDATRLNCINVEELEFHNFINLDDSDYQWTIAQSKDFH